LPDGCSRLIIALILTAGLGACGVVPEDSASSVAVPVEPVAAATRSGPYVRVVGTAQDGGLPHAGCSCERCQVARQNPARERLVASLAIVLPESDRVFLIDATPDLRRQLDRLVDVRDAPPGRVNRAPVDGVFLTHAHIGHYLGLAFFGFEAVHTAALPVYSSERMTAFLQQNGPWSQLVELGNIAAKVLEPGEPLDLGEGVRVTAVPVPHRDEYADTVGFLVEGPKRQLFYVPDTEAWGVWLPTLPEVLATVDVAVLDGTFYSADELPGRSVEDIGHPLITDSMRLLEALVDAGSLDVYFTHLNHSNPALDPAGVERRGLEQRGFAVLEDLQEIEL